MAIRREADSPVPSLPAARQGVEAAEELRCGSLRVGYAERGLFWQAWRLPLRCSSPHSRPAPLPLPEHHRQWRTLSSCINHHASIIKRQPPILTLLSPPRQQPEDHRQHHAEQDRSPQRDVNRPVLAAPREVAGQTAQRHPGFPQQHDHRATCDQQQPHPDEDPAPSIHAPSLGVNSSPHHTNPAVNLVALLRGPASITAVRSRGE